MTWLAWCLVQFSMPVAACASAAAWYDRRAVWNEVGDRCLAAFGTAWSTVFFAVVSMALLWSAWQDGQYRWLWVGIEAFAATLCGVLIFLYQLRVPPRAGPIAHPPLMPPGQPATTPPLFVPRRLTRTQILQKNGGHHTSAEWRALCAHFNHRCLACGQKRPLTKDHILPVSAGGTDDISNIQPLCRECNSSKGTRTVDYRPVRPTD